MTLKRFPIVGLLVLLAAFSFSQATAPGQTSFRIHPVRPVEELRRETLRAQPPAENGEFRNADLVELVTLDPTIKLEIRYASAANFLGTPVYSEARAFLQRPAAEALLRVHRALKNFGYGLLVYDGYRPWYVTKMFWDALPGEPGKKREFVADPATGSVHNRGCAVDLTMYEFRTGLPLEMPSGYDEMTERASATYSGGTAEERKNRQILRAAMEAEGFSVEPTEWWHFNFKDAKQYRIQNVRFEDIHSLVLAK